MELLKLSAEENPDNCHVQHLYAREFFHIGDRETALEKYLNVLEMPNIDDSQYRMVMLDSLMQVAQLYKDQKNYDEVVWYCHEFIKEDPTYKEPYYMLADIYNDQDMPVLAEAMCLAAEKYGTRKYTWVEQGNTWTSRGADCMAVTLYKLGKYEEALKYAQEVVKHEPNNFNAMKNLAAILEARLREVNSKIEVIRS